MLTPLKHYFLHKRKRLSIAFFTILIIILIDQYAHPRHVPWKPLNVNQPIGLATGIKLGLINLAPNSVCFNKLASANQFSYQQIAEKQQGNCGWKAAATMTKASSITFKPKIVTAQCSILLASYIWLKEIDKTAKKLLGSGLKNIHHAGTYSCRRQRGNSSGAWSEHAFANAWDITGFELQDGRVISVLKHWASNNAKGHFLHDARNAACRVFRVVLSPDFNAAHKDHFHLDQGPSFSCH